jgi:thiamine monophosphate synthase
MKFNNHLTNIYIFIESFNNLIEKKILKLKNIRIIYENANMPSENFFRVIKFCKINKIKLYVLDNFRIALKYKLNGLLISSYNKEISKIQSIQLKKKNIEIFGKAHNQLEFHQKMKQGCETIFLSPIFFTKKYGTNRIFGISKFNLISLRWSSRLVALGGINFSNYKKIKMSKSVGIGIKTLVKELD